MSNKKTNNIGNRQQSDVVDELKRRARRRLVGALVLFVTALIVVPAVIETGPQRTNAEIELIIPPKPEATAALTTLPPPEIQGKANLPPVPANSVTDPIDVAQQANQVKESAAKTSVPSESKDSQSPTLAENKPAQGSDSKSTKSAITEKQTAATETPASSQVKASETPAIVSPSKASEDDPIAKFAQAEPVYWVQVAALSDKTRAEQMREKLSAQGYAGRLESVKTDVGTVYRVRVGPLAGLTRATEMKDKLKASGYSGRVVQ